MRFLRQSTASQEILLGPFVASADGSAQTGLTIANTDIKLLLGGATSEQNKNSGGGTHIAGGRYSAVLDATDTATVGILEVSVNPASGIPWNKSYYVLEEAVYDAMFAASAVGPLLANSDGSGLTAINLPNQTMDIVGNITGNLSGSVGSVTGNVGGTVATVTNLTNLPTIPANWLTAAGTAADFGTEIGTAVWANGTRVLTAGTNIALAKGTGVTGFNDLSAAQVNAEVDTAISDAALATAANLATVDTVVDGIKAVTDALPDAGALTSLATAAALATVDGVADAIKLQTDQLTFDAGGGVDANITHVIGDAVQENGATDTNWGGTP